MENIKGFRMEILPFNYKNINIRTILDKKGKIWFVAKDLADILEIKNISDAISDFYDDEKDIVLNDTLGGKQTMLVLSESGLYSLLMRSRKPIAKPFQKWVTREVLPSIRKTGSYSLQNSTEPDLEQIRKRTELIEFSERQFSSFEKIFLKIGISEKNELAITSNRAVAKETGIDFIQLAELKGLEAKEKFFTVTELCEIVRNSDQFSKEFKIQISTKDGLKPRPQNLNLLLEVSNFQFRENGEWKLTKKGEDFGKLSQNKSKYSEKTVYHLVWSKKVLENLK
jgi:prophage antirepressor-like protein